MIYEATTRLQIFTIKDKKKEKEKENAIDQASTSCPMWWTRSRLFFQKGLQVEHNFYYANKTHAHKG